MSTDKVIYDNSTPDSPDWLFYCEGCKCHHGVWTSKPIIVDGKPNIWTFNGDKVNPTFSPSIHIKRQITIPPLGELKGTIPPLGEPKGVEETICHSIITAGKINYLSDCKHDLKGKTIDLLIID